MATATTMGAGLSTNGRPRVDDVLVSSVPLPHRHSVCTSAVILSSSHPHACCTTSIAPLPSIPCSRDLTFLPASHSLCLLKTAVGRRWERRKEGGAAPLAYRRSPTRASSSPKKRDSRRLRLWYVSCCSVFLCRSMNGRTEPRLAWDSQIPLVGCRQR